MVTDTRSSSRQSGTTVRTSCYRPFRLPLPRHPRLEPPRIRLLSPLAPPRMCGPTTPPIRPPLPRLAYPRLFALPPSMPRTPATQCARPPPVAPRQEAQIRLSRAPTPPRSYPSPSQSSTTLSPVDHPTSPSTHDSLETMPDQLNVDTWLQDKAGRELAARCPGRPVAPRGVKVPVDKSCWLPQTA
ncbi:hypothetical protein HETIRDRAFT_387710, partial [Heterobasidion irregulare TC 32-1]